MATPRPAKPRAEKVQAEKTREKSRHADTPRTPKGEQAGWRGVLGKVTGRRWIFVLVIVVVFALLFSTVYWRPIKIYYRELRQATVARSQLREVRAYNKELRAEISSLETTAGIEEYARRSLGLVEEGDHTIVVYQNGEPINQEGETIAVEINESPAVKEPFGQWTRFLDRLLLGR